MAYKYYNNNPGKETIPDCVVRAISLAMNIPYCETEVLIVDNSGFNCCEPLNLSCYAKLLDDYFGLIHLEPRYVRQVRDIARDFSDEVLIIRIDGHLTCSLYGTVYDIWDCTREVVTDFWLV